MNNPTPRPACLCFDPFHDGECGDKCRTNFNDKTVSEYQLILSLQKQIEDLRKNAREYARKDLIAELRWEIEKMKYTFKEVDWGDGLKSEEPIETDTISNHWAKGSNEAINKVLAILSAAANKTKE